MRNTFEEQIQRLERDYHQQLLVPPPDDILLLWQKAISDVLPVRHLYVVTLPLKWGTRGSRDTFTGDTWVLHSGPDDLRETRITMLHELAHAKRSSSAPHTMDEHWDEEEATYQTAFMLAREWGVNDFFTQDDLDDRLEIVERLRSVDEGIASLIGTKDLVYVRWAYDILRPLAVKRGWDLAVFQEAVNGWSEDSERTALMLDMDRALLRESWNISCVGGDMGQLTMPVDPASLRHLHSALRQVACEPSDGGSMLIAGGGKGISLDIVNGIYSLPDALRVLNSALLAHREARLRVMCAVYGDSRETAAPRLYRFSIAYDARIKNECLWPEREVWVLFSLRHEHDVVAEVAWQRYISSWSRLLEIRQESLSDGLAILLELFRGGGRDAEPAGQAVVHLTGPFAPHVLGRVVRESWVRRYRGRANPKKEHLFPYDTIGQWDQETDDLIGMDVLFHIVRHRRDYLIALLMGESALEGVQLPSYERMKEIMRAAIKNDDSQKSQGE